MASSNRDAVTVIVRIRPPDAETRQYAGGLTVQERRAQLARGFHDDPHDVVQLASGQLEGRRVPGAAASSAASTLHHHQHGGYNIVTVQQIKITVPSSAALPGERPQRSSSAEPAPLQQRGWNNNSNNPRSSHGKLVRSSSAKIGGRTGAGGAQLPLTTPEKQIAAGQREQLREDAFGATAPVRCARHVFEFDACFSSNPEHPAFADQSRIFGAVGRPAVEHALKGFNVTCLTYGATGAGKSWTLFGASQHLQQQQQATALVAPTAGMLGRNGTTATGTAAAAQHQQQQQQQRAMLSARQHKLYDERGLVYRVAEALCNRMSQIRRSNSRAKSRSMSVAGGNVPSSTRVSEEPEPRRPGASLPMHHNGNGDGVQPPAAPHSVMTVTVSFFEIYCDRIRCLLNPSRAAGESLRVREHKSTGPFVEGLEEVPVSTVEDVYRVVERGTANRHVGATLHNHHSSRSHALLLFHIHQRQRASFAAASSSAAFDSAATAAAAAAAANNTSVFLSSKLYLVDLAGSERVSPHDEAESTHRSEAKYINSSLSVLGKVITALAQVPALAHAAVDRSGGGSRQGRLQRGGGGGGAHGHRAAVYVPYRDSVFTRLLRDSFGGNSKTFMIAAVSPEVKDLEETISTLRYASRARFIQNRPVVNSALQAADRDRDALIESLARRVEELEAQLSAAQSSSATATAAQLSAAAAALAQGLHQQHEQSSATSSAPQTRATSQQQPQSTVTVGAVRWGDNIVGPTLPSARQQQQQHIDMPPPMSARSTLTTSTTSMSMFSAAASSAADATNPLYQELLQRSNQQQAMLERIEEREALLLRILARSDADALMMLSPPQLMRGPTATPGPAKVVQDPARTAAVAAALALANRHTNDADTVSAPPRGVSTGATSKQLSFLPAADAQQQQLPAALKPALRSSASRSASANSNSGNGNGGVVKTTHFAARSTVLPAEERGGDGDEDPESIFHVDEKENERKFIMHVLHHHPPPPPSSSSSSTTVVVNHQPFERTAQQLFSLEQHQFASLLPQGRSLSHLVKTPTRASRSASAATVAGSPEGVSASRHVLAQAHGGGGKSPSVTPPPNATPIHHDVAGFMPQRIDDPPRKSALTTQQRQQQQPQPQTTQYRSNAPRAFVTVAAAAAQQPQQQQRAGSGDGGNLVSAVDEKRAALLARAEALRKRKSELAQRWQEVKQV